MARARAISRVRRVYVRRRSRARRKFTLPLAVVGGFAPMGLNVFANVKRVLAGDTAGGVQGIVINTTGYNTDTKQFHWPTFAANYAPILAGFIVHKLANRLGVNRFIGKSGIPIVRI